MILYYHDACKDEFEIVSLTLNWQKIQFTIKQMPEALIQGKRPRPILASNDGQIMGEGLIGVVKHLDSRGIFNARA